LRMDSQLSPLETLKRSSRWLNEFASDVYSQTGEDGVIAKVLDMLPDRSNWCVEFGAWDGKHLSNTYNLVENRNYNVVLIEGDRAKYERLCKEYPFQENAVFVGQFVGWTEDDNLDTILEKHPVPLDFDLLSIDVDGNDFHIWKAVRKFRPKLVLIEFNPTSSNRFMYVQAADASRNQSSSPAPIVQLSKDKGYELIAVIGPNLLFVDQQYYSLFHISDNSLEVMRDEDEVTHLFMGFDGSLIVDGPALLRWHHMRELKVKQPFPKVLRRYPPNYNRWQSLLFRVWSRLN
jgi:methyltransferase FkbM-like protein